MNWFLLGLPEPDQAVQASVLDWARVGAGGNLVERGSTPLEGVSEQIGAHDRVVALVPGERALLYHVAIPARSRSAQLQALPYALEERLSEDLEAMHIVPGPRLTDGQLLAAVAARRDMDSWLEALRDARVEPRYLLPDTALLPTGPEDHFQIFAHPERCLIQTPGGEPLALATELLPWWLEHWQAQVGQEMNVVWHGPAELAPAGVRDRPGFEAREWDGDLLALAAPALRRRPALNLLSGRYAPAGSGAEVWSRWRVPAAIAAGLLLLWGGSLWLDLRHLETEVQQVDRAITDLFEATLPGTRMVDPSEQFRLVLESGSQEGDLGPAGPIARRLAHAAPALARAGVELQQLRADADRLELQLELDSITALDSLRSRLREGTAANVRILSAESDEQGVRARLQIEGNGS
jgi:general secretion pathway protein L